MYSNQASRSAKEDRLLLCWGALNGGCCLRDLPQFDVAFVVVWHPHLLPAVLVEAAEIEHAYSALSVCENGILILELAGITGWVQGMGSVVAVTSHKDVCPLVVVLALRVEGIGEAWTHIWDSQGEGVVEVARNCLASPIVLHRVVRELVSPNAVLAVVGLVIVDQQLARPVAVQVHHRHVVGAEDQLIVDDLALDEGSIDS